MPYHPPEFPNQPKLSRPPPELIDDEEEYEIEEIVGERDRAWKGYPAEENSWVTCAHLANAEKLVKEYKACIQKIEWTKQKDGVMVGKDDKILNLYDIPDSSQEWLEDIKTPYDSEQETLNPPPYVIHLVYSEHLAPVANACASDANSNFGHQSITSSLLKRVQDTAAQMDCETKEGNARYLWENNLKEDKMWKHMPYKPDPKFDNDKVCQ
ncbi:uncharacterized protein EV420DRAFT_1650089 [Desarmillaria tabescens]|uniref:Chromo domain-containing protein n=1 Tax=Armillaria tabescens TaxID=1929756 RepID=A0AA39MPI5_ARMTA|nr:uncharacterized protein EV420DRAFT_1650089 [Desarmillaria tabescens]KAK0441483.1 hypothetical protein EV420DRAFT_1650089 [Desarmillaria tabescens]